jgi:hypothetical protein
MNAFWDASTQSEGQADPSYSVLSPLEADAALSGDSGSGGFLCIEARFMLCVMKCLWYLPASLRDEVQQDSQVIQAGDAGCPLADNSQG